jgi:hypothetical protein
MDGLAYSDVVKEIIAKQIIDVASRTRAADPEWLVDEAILADVLFAVTEGAAGCNST